MRIKQAVFALTTLVVGCVIAVVFAELTLRVLGTTSRLVYRPNAYYGWGHTPNDRFSWNTEGRDVEVEINSLGLRDKEYPYQKPADTLRVLVLGDSFPEALQVPLDESFSEVLESALAGAAPGARKIEVLNAGVSGYGTDNALLFFLNEGYKYSPDIVLLTFYIGNDVRNNWYRLEERDSGGARKPHFEPGADGLVLEDYPFAAHESFTTRVKVFLNRHFRLYSFARELRDRLQAANNVSASSPGTAIPLDLQLFRGEPGAEWETAWTVTDGLLGKLQQEVQARAGRLLVVNVPTAFQIHADIWQSRLSAVPSLADVDWTFDAPNQRLDEICVRHGIDHVDLLEPLRAAAADTGSQLYLVSDNHWNANGHRTAALLVKTKVLEMLGAASR